MENVLIFNVLINEEAPCSICWSLTGVSVYGPFSTWRAGHLDQDILLVWPYFIAFP